MDIHNKIAMGIGIAMIIVVGLLGFVDAQSIHGEGITTIAKEFDSELDIFDEIQKIYEIGDSSLGKGVSEILNEKDAFKIRIRERDYYIIVWDINEDNVSIYFPRDRMLSYEIGAVALIDINQDGSLGTCSDQPGAGGTCTCS